MNTMQYAPHPPYSQALQVRVYHHCVHTTTWLSIPSIGGVVWCVRAHDAQDIQFRAQTTRFDILLSYTASAKP
jgi:hypothetical protein